MPSPLTGISGSFASELKGYLPRELKKGKGKVPQRGLHAVLGEGQYYTASEITALLGRRAREKKKCRLVLGLASVPRCVQRSTFCLAGDGR